MNSRVAVAQSRTVRLDFWLARQKSSPKYNVAVEAAEAFKKRLADWAANPDPRAHAPTFHYAPGVC